ncbi:unnamed protein product [Durusdinium trenchii]|uniref:EF-hand domain-containing protein n=1 Tax=Durusdinium trenchii TaxID=1381693 RepID=A0ABP0LDA2_9DINO
MPEDPVARGQWAMEKLMTDLQQAKMWPVKLAHLKHQDALSNMACCSNYGCVSAKLTICFLCAKVEKGGDFLVQLNAAVTLAMQRLQLYQEDAKEGDLKWVKSQYHLFNYQTNNICSNCGVQKTHPNVAMTLANFEEDAPYCSVKPCRTLASATYVSLRVTTRSIWSRLRELAGTEEMARAWGDRHGWSSDLGAECGEVESLLKAFNAFDTLGSPEADLSGQTAADFAGDEDSARPSQVQPQEIELSDVSQGIRKRHSESLSVKPRDGSGYIEWEEFRQAAVQTDGRCTGRVGAAPAARGDAEPVTTTIRQVVCTMLKVPGPVDSGLYEEPDPWAAAATAIRPPTPGYRKPAAKSSAKATAAKTMPQKKSPIPEFSSDPEELEEDLPMDDEWEEINPIGPQDIAMSSMENDVLAQHCEMMTAPAMDGDAQHTELICLNTNCSLAIYLYQLPDYYLRMGSKDATTSSCTNTRYYTSEGIHSNIGKIPIASTETTVKEPTDISEARLARYWNEAAAWRMSRPEVGGFGPGREDGEDPKVQGRVKR